MVEPIKKTQKHKLNQEGRTVGTDGQAKFLQGLLPLVKMNTLLFEDEDETD
jgi:hypothetical protein